MKVYSKAKYVFLSVLLIAVYIPVAAQNAQNTMEKTARQFRKNCPARFSLEITNFDGLKPIGTSHASLTVDTRRFKLESSEMTVWFDGKTQWSHYAGSDEVNVSTPTTSELQTINPMALIETYKHGYALSQTTTTYRGKACTQVSMKATSKSAPITTILLVIDENYNPLSIRVKQKSGNWLRVRISSRQSRIKASDNDFRYNPKENASLQIIDLR